jgi:hypothetical protein
MKGGSFTRDVKGKMNYKGKCRRKLWKQVSLSMGARWETWRVHLLGILIVKEDSTNGASLSAGAVRGTCNEKGSFAGDLE